MGRRTLLLIAALVIAALGTTGIFLYINGVDERAAAGNKLVKVLVAKTAVAAGTSGQQAQDAAAFEQRSYLADSVEGLDVLSNPSTILDQVALAPIAQGSPILQSQWGAPGQTNALPIPDGKLAVSLQLDDPARVAGFVEPGSKVAVFLTTTETSGPSAGQEVTRILLPEVQVIATGATTLVTTVTGSGDAAQTEQLPKALMTLAVDQKQAQQIVFGQGHGKVTFGLLTDSSQVDQNEAGTTAKNLFN